MAVMRSENGAEDGNGVRMTGRFTRLRSNKAITYWIRLFLQLGRQFVEDKLLMMAQALAFQTILSLVPLLTVAFVGLNAFHLTEARDQILDKMTDVFPGMPPEFGATLLDFTQKISGGALGGFGMIITAYLGFSLFKLVEGVFNQIWRTSQKRSMVQKFMVFYAIATLLPVLTGVSLTMTSTIPSQLTALKFAAPAIVATLALTIMYKLMPMTRVRWSAALLGGGLAALAFQLAKAGFGLYVSVALVKQQGIYGAIGLLPLLFLWIFLAWVIVLFGCEISYAAQNLTALELAVQLQRSHGKHERTVLAARLLLTCATIHRDGGGAASRRNLALLFQLPEEAIERIMGVLRARNLAIEIPSDTPAYVPARPPEKITLDELFPTLSLTDGSVARSAKLDALAAEMDAWRTKRLGTLTLFDLMEAPGAVAVAMREAAAEALTEEQMAADDDFRMPGQAPSEDGQPPAPQL
jgi:membrane protein